MDVDLEKFFDRVNHDILMARLVAKVWDAGGEPGEATSWWEKLGLVNLVGRYVSLQAS